MRTSPRAVLSLLLLAPALAVAQRPAPSAPLAPLAHVDSVQLAGLQWRNIGPNRGGRSLAASGSPSRPMEYYFGAVGGGVWKSTDAGLNWAPVSDGKVNSSSVGALAVAESNPDIVYIGMGETEIRGNIMQGDGVYKTTDAGKTWTHCGLEQTQAIARIRVDKSNPDLVYVAALGHPYSPNAERGIFKSTDGCKSWKKVLFKDDSTGAIDISVDRTNPNVIFASLWRAGRTPWSMWSGGPGSDLYKSTDAGETWSVITRNPGLPSGIIGKIGVSVSPVDGNRVFALVENENGGLFRSDDAGATWTKVNVERKLRQRAFYYTRVYADPQDKERVYVENVQFWRSDDGGKAFREVNVPHGDNHDLWIAPNDNKRVIVANDEGGTVSANDGATWTDFDFPTAQSYHVTLTNEVMYHVCGAQQDESTFCVPAYQQDPRADATFAYDVGGGESGYIANDPKNPNIFYAGSQGALLTRYDRSNGTARDVQVYPRFFSGEPSSALKERWQWTYPIVFSPVDPKRLYTSSQHLWLTTNEGRSWTKISPDLTKADPKTLGPTGGPITKDMNGPEIYATIYTVAPSYHDVNTIWTGSDDGLVHITRDGGKSWTNITPKDLPPFSRVSLIDASRHKAGTAYLAAKRYQLDDRSPYIYRTNDFGKSWTKIVSGIPADDYVHAVREDVKRAGLLFAGTEHGVYVSFDDGAHWNSLARNLPNTQVSDIAVHDRDLVIATHGRSMYVMDNIAPLRQVTPATIAAPLHVYAPREARRGLDPLTVYYTLRDSVDTLKVEILDPAGKVVRTFTGAPQPRAAAGADGSANDFRRGGGEPRPSRNRGLNRFVWDGRYPGSTVFEGMIMWSANPGTGPSAPPGSYVVRVSAAGQSMTQPFVVQRDPRVSDVTDADLKAQFDLAIKVRDKVTAANEAVIQARKLRTGVQERAKSLGGDIAAAAVPVSDSLTALERDVYQTQSSANQDLLNFPIKINNRLASLERSILTGDARPTAGAYQVYDELSAELQLQLLRLKRIINGDVASFNRLVQAKGGAPLVP
ncbi:MAG: glycosyl hydrolase [Gemmatimonadetes bacterium]|nr:glycosyl hydrolase [Gemmatimonadota bacterium]